MSVHDKLTGRQSEVFNLLCKGHSNCEIASQLGITENTVEAHLRAIYNRLGVRSRVEAVKLHFEDGDQTPVNGDPG